MKDRTLLSLSLGLLLGGLCSGPAVLAGEVTSERLVAALDEPHNWLTYRGDYSGRNHRPLKQITRENVSALRVQWVFQTGVSGKIQTVPLVADGIMYLTAPYNTGYALDVRTGRVIWRYRRQLPRQSLCCGPINRGFAILGDKLFMATLDSHLLALDRKTGSVLWDVTLGDYTKGYSSTVAPLIVKDKVIRRYFGRRVPGAVFSGCLRCRDGKAGLAVLDHPRPGRTRVRKLERRFLENGRRSHLDDRHLRSPT